MYLAHSPLGEPMAVKVIRGIRRAQEGWGCGARLGSLTRAFTDHTIAVPLSDPAMPPDAVRMYGKAA
ncbi:hypothetical protein [Streptomyces sp. NBC_00057]|uniref:hypothetical protein n=1 Tax=Streptomyces sp. NBC_00057 TaxID=2975634 RepID=UPI00324950CD